MGLGAAIGSGIAYMAGAVGLGDVAATTIAGVTVANLAGGVVAGAAVGAGGAALTGGNPLVGALTGGLTGGLGAGGAGAALGSALGTSATVGNSLIGAGVGAAGSALSKGNPITGALGGAAAGALSGLGGGSGASTGQAPVDSAFVNPDGSVVVPPVPPMLGADGNPILNANGNPVYPTQSAATAAAGNNALSAPGGAGYSADGSGSDTSGLNPQSAAAANGSGGGIGGALSKGLSNPALLLGGLSALTSLMNKPQQGTYGLTPQQLAAVQANQGPYYNQPLNIMPGSGAQPTTPNVPNYYTYGSMPGGASYFNNNSLAAYGFKRGGALSAVRELVPNEHNRHVQGPGTSTSDSIPARLSDGEYILDARDVSLIGGGDNDRGARILDRERRKLNRNKGGALSQIGRAGPYKKSTTDSQGDLL